MTATERLRAMLDERGVDWRRWSGNSKRNTQWFMPNSNIGSDMPGNYCVTVNEHRDGTLYFKSMIASPEQAIAATLGSNAKPCYAADANYERCKYSVNRGWCDDAPFLVWDDTSHLFITVGGLKTWDVTDDAKKWFATLGAGTCKFVGDAKHPPKCSACGWQTSIYDCEWLEDGEYEYDGNFCKQCGRRVEP